MWRPEDASATPKRHAVFLTPGPMEQVYRSREVDKLFPINPKWIKGPQIIDSPTFKKFPLGVIVKRFESGHPHIMDIMAAGVKVHSHFRRHVAETD